MDASIRRCERIVISKCRRGRDRLRKNCNEVSRLDLTALGLMKDTGKDRTFSSCLYFPQRFLGYFYFFFPVLHLSLSYLLFALTTI